MVNRSSCRQNSAGGDNLRCSGYRTAPQSGPRSPMPRMAQPGSAQMTDGCVLSGAGQMAGSCPTSNEYPSSGNRSQTDHCCESDRRTLSRGQLRTMIDESSFAAYDALLYLDTHPTDTSALAYFQEQQHKRMHALREYAQQYGPLNLAQVQEGTGSAWEWATQAWPWEGGDC